MSRADPEVRASDGTSSFRPHLHRTRDLLSSSRTEPHYVICNPNALLRSGEMHGKQSKPPLPLVSLKHLLWPGRIIVLRLVSWNPDHITLYVPCIRIAELKELLARSQRTITACICWTSWHRKPESVRVRTTTTAAAGQVEPAPLHGHQSLKLITVIYFFLVIDVTFITITLAPYFQSSSTRETLFVFIIQNIHSVFFFVSLECNASWYIEYREKNIIVISFLHLNAILHWSIQNHVSNDEEIIKSK